MARLVEKGAGTGQAARLLAVMESALVALVKTLAPLRPINRRTVNDTRPVPHLDSGDCRSPFPKYRLCPLDQFLVRAVVKQQHATDDVVLDQVTAHPHTLFPIPTPAPNRVFAAWPQNLGLASPTRQRWERKCEV